MYLYEVPKLARQLLKTPVSEAKRAGRAKDPAEARRLYMQSADTAQQAGEMLRRFASQVYDDFN